MSVLIKDMEMPKKCGECDIYVCYRTWHGDPGDEFCGLTKKNVTYKTKPEWCPLSEAPERKTGKWIRHIRYGDGASVFADLDWECSECGKNAIVDLEGLYQLTYFCPFCGAKMEVE